MTGVGAIVTAQVRCRMMVVGEAASELFAKKRKGRRARIAQQLIDSDRRREKWRLKDRCKSVTHSQSEGGCVNA